MRNSCNHKEAHIPLRVIGKAYLSGPNTLYLSSQYIKNLSRARCIRGYNKGKQAVGAMAEGRE